MIVLLGVVLSCLAVLNTIGVSRLGAGWMAAKCICALVQHFLCPLSGVGGVRSLEEVIEKGSSRCSRRIERVTKVNREEVQ